MEPNRWDAAAAHRAANRARVLLATFDREHSQVERERAIAGVRHEVDTILWVLVGAVDLDPGGGQAAGPEMTQGVLFES